MITLGFRVSLRERRLRRRVTDYPGSLKPTPGCHQQSDTHDVLKSIESDIPRFLGLDWHSEVQNNVFKRVMAQDMNLPRLFFLRALERLCTPGIVTQGESTSMGSNPGLASPEARRDQCSLIKCIIFKGLPQESCRKHFKHYGVLDLPIQRQTPIERIRLVKQRILP
eukprot:4674962-Amphidinium_carterae.1